MELYLKTVLQKIAQSGLSPTVLFRTGDVPNSVDDFPLDNVKAILQDPNTVAGIPKGWAYPDKAAPLNCTTLVTDSTYYPLVENTWSIPFLLSSVDQEIDAISTYYGDERLLPYLAGSLSLHLGDRVYPTGVNPIYQGATLNNVTLGSAGNTITTEFSKAHMVDTVAWTSYYRSNASNGNYAPNNAVTEYLDPVSNEWLEMFPALNLNGVSNGVGYSATKTLEHRSGSTSYWYRHTLQLDEPVYAKAVRFRYVSSGGGWIAGMSIFSTVKPDLPVTKPNDITHVLVYTRDYGDSGRFKSKPFILEVGSGKPVFIANTQDDMANCLPDIDYTFGVTNPDDPVLIASENQVNMARYYAETYLKLGNVIYNYIFEADRVFSLAEVETAINSTSATSEKILDACTSLGAKLLKVKSAFVSNGLDPVVEVQRTEPQTEIIYRVASMDSLQYAHNIAEGKARFSIMLVSSRSSYSDTTTQNTFFILSMGDIGSGADIEVSNLDLKDDVPLTFVKDITFKLDFS